MKRARGQLRPRQRTLQAPLAVLRQTPAARHPGEGPLHDPAAMENHETLDILGFFDDLKIGSDAELRERGRQLPSSASAVRPDFLDVRRLLQHSEDHRRSSVPILHRSRVDGEPEREPLDVDDEVALAPLGLLARVVARRPAALRRLRRLGVDRRRCRGRRASRQTAPEGAKPVHHPGEDPVATPEIEIILNRRKGQKTKRKGPPLASGFRA